MFYESVFKINNDIGNFVENINKVHIQTISKSYPQIIYKYNFLKNKKVQFVEFAEVYLRRSKIDGKL